MMRKVTVLYLCSHKGVDQTDRPEVPAFRLVPRPCPACCEGQGKPYPESIGLEPQKGGRG